MSKSSSSKWNLRAMGRGALRPLALLALTGVVGVAAAVGIGGHGDGPWKHGASHAASADPAARAAHVDRMIEHVYVEIEPTSAQKARLEPLLRQAAAWHFDLHGGLGRDHEQLLALFGQERFDRDALESLRTEHVRRADEASRTFVGLVADIAETLTPAQRALVLERIAQHHGAGPG